MAKDSWQIWIDTGGTFTDCFALDPDEKSSSLKVLSNSSLRCTISLLSADKWKVRHNWPITKNILNGYQARVLETGELLEVLDFDAQKSEISFQSSFEINGNEFLELAIESQEEVPVFAARILTQTSLKDDLPPTEMRLGSTRGTNALLERNGARTAFLVTSGFKDLIRIGTQQREDLFSLQVIKPEPYFDHVFEIKERVNAKGEITRPFDTIQMEELCQKLLGLGIESIAIALLNSYKNPTHEQQLGKILEDSGFKHISLSSELFNAIKILPRAETAVANAYLSPVIKNYISNIESSVFSGHEGDLKVMTSAGGLIASNAFKPKDSLLSGPAGGLVGASVAARKSSITRILTLDMGGTSTDVARYDNGFDYRYETKVGNARILSPALFIETIAAGGGSICRFDGFRFTVGPESARANPGPACYGAGGPLTITDVNLMLGKIDPDNFGIPVHIDASNKALEEVQSELSVKYERSYSREEILSGFEQIANEKMAEAIKKISVSKGYDPQEYSLLAFGGAGGQHACQIAEILGMDKVLIPQDAGLLSAFGIGQAYIERFAEKQVLLPFNNAFAKIESILNELEGKVKEELKKEGFTKEEIQIRDTFFYLRFEGQENTLEVKDKLSILQHFKQQYESLYGHWIENREIELESIKVAGCNIKNVQSEDIDNLDEYEPQSQGSHTCWIRDKWETIPSFDRALLNPGGVIEGPAVIGSITSTSFIQEGWKCVLDQSGNCLIEKVNGVKEYTISTGKPMEAELELFSNRFTAVAEEMGAMFQRTSFSVNIKERLDFSCAVLDAKGFLVVNAPHIPVHLGSLGICVRKLRENINMQEGDVIITNHPGYGGSHLPDITLVSPFYFEGQLAGFVANRGHHAEVGGMLPGSMPPEARSLLEEGVVIEPTYLVKKGEARWEHIRKVFLEAPYPTRSIEENIADLNGALASIRMGVEQMTKLIQHYGLSTIQSFMTRIREHAHKALLDALTPYDGKHLKAIEHLDNGAELNVEITINHPNVIFDFSHTSGEQKDNFNATPAITTSAILYVLRLIANKDIPLNEGLLNTVEIKLPRNLLNPDFDRPASECPPGCWRKYRN